MVYASRPMIVISSHPAGTVCPHLETRDRLDFRSSPRYMNTSATMDFSNNSATLPETIFQAMPTCSICTGGIGLSLAHLNIVLGVDFSFDIQLLLTSALSDSVTICNLDSREVI